MATGRIIAERWLSNKLKALGVGVYRHPSPDTSSFPHITIGLLTGRDVRVMSDPVRKEIIRYDISAWDKSTSSLRVNELASQIVKAIDGKTPETVEFTANGITYKGVINGCRRVGVIPIATVIEAGTRYERDGGMFEIEVLT